LIFLNLIYFLSFTGVTSLRPTGEILNYQSLKISPVGRNDNQKNLFKMSCIEILTELFDLPTTFA